MQTRAALRLTGWSGRGRDGWLAGPGGPGWRGALGALALLAGGMGALAGCGSAAAARAGAGPGSSCGTTRTAANVPVIVKVAQGTVSCGTAIQVENQYA